MSVLPSMQKKQVIFDNDDVPDGQKERQTASWNNDQVSANKQTDRVYSDDSVPSNDRITKLLKQHHLEQAGQEHGQEVVSKTIDSGIQEGIKAHVKEQVQKEEKAKKVVEELVSRHDITLLRAKTIFPFDFFPDTLVIDSSTVSIIEKHFIASERVTTISFKDLLDVSVETAWFTANLTIRYMPKAATQGMNEPIEEKISLLKRADAVKARNILKGVMFIRNEDVDITKLGENELYKLVEGLGERGVGI